MTPPPRRTGLAALGRPRNASLPSRIGQARPSQLITTTGVGAVADLPSMSVVVRGLDAWKPDHQEIIEEPRLLQEVRRALGQQVRNLRSAPWESHAADDPWTATGVPVAPFPRWVRCPACFRLGVLDGHEFTLVHRIGRRPDLAKFVHATCPRQTQKREAGRRACIPARFVVVCEAGHLDDFPYVEYVHHGWTGAPCPGAQLAMSDAASTLSPRVTIRCTQCKGPDGKTLSRSMTEAAGRHGWEALPRCRGRHPHLQRFESCGRPLRLSVLGASDLWFSVTASALHLPTGEGIADVVVQNWELLSAQASAGIVQILVDQLPALRALRAVPVDQVWKVIEELRGSGGPTPARAESGLLEAEWALLSRPTTDKQDRDFKATPTTAPEGYGGLLDQVVLVSRLREVQALIGFTRNAAPERRDLAPQGRISLARGPAQWVPAVEQRGEGVFLELQEDRVARWAASVSGHDRIQALGRAYARWAQNRDQDVVPHFPIPRYVLLHTLAHLLIRQVSLECGYSSASIRERLYIGTKTQPAAGVLLSTAASDSEGTLGGLVALGQPRHLRRLLDGAFDEAERCSSDPLCSEHVPAQGSDKLHAAACHACLFASETSCENNNRWLDRAVLVDLTRDGLAFPR